MLQGPVCQPSVPSIKEGWTATTNDQTEEVEHIHILKTFQDGRAPSIKEHFGTKQLSMKVEPQRCLFLCSNKQSRRYVRFK